ncbi:unnamed protein product [Adineta steineri]|uniref:Uncharacterized protein n=1 Tax=Adineta steineri TaxID=433720 RepID=A0A815T0N1_9BILA|nr:unnamed protein product [Adineta steineri]CAF3901241.1 unnamed protein product [Adineta steineri]
MVISSSSWFVDLLPLVNLRSLYLAQCSEEQFKQLINMRQLTRLSLPCNSYSSTFLGRFVLGKEEERFPHLQSIDRIWCDYTSFEKFSATTMNTKIRHIHIVVPSCSSPANFIQRLPELNSITVDYLGSEIEFPSSCFILAKLRPQRNDGLSKVSLKKDSSSKPIDQNNLLLITFAPYVYSLEIDFNGHCDFVKLARILQHCSNLERIQIRVKYYPKGLDLDSIRQLNPFFVNFTFGDVHKETGNPVIMTKWSL